MVLDGVCILISSNIHSDNYSRCNQVGWYQVGPPEGQPAIVSRILQPIYEEVRILDLKHEHFST
jgi:hypothetical protein